MDVEGDIDRSDLILLLLLLLLLSMHIFHYLIQCNAMKSNQQATSPDATLIILSSVVVGGRGGFLSERHYLPTHEYLEDKMSLYYSYVELTAVQAMRSNIPDTFLPAIILPAHVENIPGY